MLLELRLELKRKGTAWGQYPILPNHALGP